jgi:hypothetical protein
MLPPPAISIVAAAEKQKNYKDNQKGCYDLLQIYTLRSFRR